VIKFWRIVVYTLFTSRLADEVRAWVLARAYLTHCRLCRVSRDTLHRCKKN